MIMRKELKLKNQVGELEHVNRFIEEIGTYNPLTEPAEIKVDSERALAWIKNGAQPTDTVKNLLKRAGVI